MATTKPDNRKSDRQSKAAVRRLLTAMDRLVVVAKQVERARDEVARKAEKRNE